jgi:ferric hydroxamate transport system permease protein
MKKVFDTCGRPDQRKSAAALVLVFGSLAMGLALRRFDAFLPTELWPGLIMDPRQATIHETILLQVMLPRSVMAIVCGMALGLSGAIFQLILNNPLAEPTTLGVSAGATLSTVISLTYFPSLAANSELAAITGALMALIIVVGLSLRARLSATTLVLAGLLINLYCASVASIAVLTNHELLDSIFLWQAGSLHQNSWDGVVHLVPTVLFCACLLALLQRPLSSLLLGDETARSLGVSPTVIRLFFLLLATVLAATTVAYVGMIGFIGLAAPALGRAAGLRSMGWRIIGAGVVGGMLLWLTDEIVQLATAFVGEVPAGAFTSLIGAPLLLAMIARQRGTSFVRELQQLAQARRSDKAMRAVFWLPAIAALATAAVLVGKSSGSWQVSLDPDILQWRWPRGLGALSGGALLGSAGFLLQRLTGNPLAGPEVLGVSSAAALGVACQLLLSSDPTTGLDGAAIGAALGLVAVFVWGSRNSTDPLKLLLVGVALNLLFGAILGLLLATGHPRLRGVIAWLSGSTANITPEAAVISAGVTILLVSAPLVFSRWLTVAPLGAQTSRALGLPVAGMNGTILLFAAISTGVSTTLLGPTTFLGLLAPTLVRLAGIRAVTQQALGSILAGSILALVGDWFGRTVLFPWEIPAGLVVSFVAVPVMIAMLIGRAR